MNKSSGQTRVLVVDDELEWALETAHHLASLPPQLLGSRTLEIEIANDAYFVASRVGESSERRPWDIIISDVFMPKPAGRNVAGAKRTEPKRQEKQYHGRKYIVWESELGSNDPNPQDGGFHIAEKVREIRCNAKHAYPKLVLISSRLVGPDRRRLDEFLPSEAAWFDFYEKPFSHAGDKWLATKAGLSNLKQVALPLDVFKRALLLAVQHLDSELWGQQVLVSALGVGEFVGKSPAMETFLTRLSDLVDRGERELLILGERHTGKRSLRGIVRRRLEIRAGSGGLPCERIFCPQLFEGDFGKVAFGREQAGGPAGSPQAGLLQSCGGGLLFLEDIHGLRPEPLARLLEFLRQRRRGGQGSALLPALVVCTANENLDLWRAGDALPRELMDLFAGTPLRMPALRERQEDIEALARLAVRQAGRDISINPGALEWLKQQPWHGNLMEFMSVVRVRANSSFGAELTLADFETEGSLTSTPVATLTASGVPAEVTALIDQGTKLFQRKGAMWRVMFDGTERFVPDCEPLRWLVLLLDKPNTELSVDELRTAKGEPVVAANRQAYQKAAYGGSDGEDDNGEDSAQSPGGDANRADASYRSHRQRIDTSFKRAIRHVTKHFPAAGGYIAKNYRKTKTSKKWRASIRFLYIGQPWKIES
ncbi:MAG TPA: sigma 54-interacting transcriptional regulator [Verrucomicrobiae bacterium]